MAEGTVVSKYLTSDSMFLVGFRTAAGMTNNEIKAPVLYFPYRVINAWGIMIGAGAASDTVQLKKLSGGSESAISDAVDVSAKGDKVFFNFGTIDDATYGTVDGDQLLVETASDALVEVWVLCAKV